MVDIINFAPFFELKVSAAGAVPAVAYVFSFQSAQGGYQSGLKNQLTSNLMMHFTSPFQGTSSR